MQFKIGIIPARYASSRFPGKPLAQIAGKSMLQRVYEQASSSTLLDQVCIATDDERIFKAAENFDAKVIMTSSEHLSGTDRIAEAARLLHIEEGLVLNIQGDQPFIDPRIIDSLIEKYIADPYEIATAICPVKSADQLTNPTKVKVTVDAANACKSFERRTENAKWLHIGIYAFDNKVLQKLVKLEPTENEMTHSLEQLRWMDNGYQIKSIEWETELLSVDTIADLKAAEIRAKSE